ncbi:MAG: cytochrome-c peroxidase [Saprospiraceae bacterium]|nr:cytochrome-c peroxidase [Saprospiraceae bacterium]
MKIRSFLYLLFLPCLMLFSCSDVVVDVTDQGEPVLDGSYDYTAQKLPLGLSAASNFVVIDPINGFPVLIDNSTAGGVFTGGGGLPFEGDFNLIERFVKVTNAGASLGRVLFYDKKLSLNNTVSCASCHHQDKAFSDGLALSGGFEGRVTSRNSMAIINPITQNNLFWDSRSQSIKDLSLKPVQNHIEMGMEDIQFLEDKLQKINYYGELFEAAYGDSEITGDRISDALSQFIASITTADSKFDQRSRGEAVAFTELENMGMNIFFSSKAKCSSCHAGANFSAPDGIFDPYGGGSANGEDLRGTANIGLDLIPEDVGKENGSFKIPSLRNITLTAPYMHDGRFNTLEEVLNHYTTGIKANPNLDPKFMDDQGRVTGIKLSTLEKKAIIAFLGTLEDNTYTRDPKFSNPFLK